MFLDLLFDDLTISFLETAEVAMRLRELCGPVEQECLGLADLRFDVADDLRYLPHLVFLQLPLMYTLRAEKLVFVAVNDRSANAFRYVRVDDVFRVLRAFLVWREVSRRL